MKYLIIPRYTFVVLESIADFGKIEKGIKNISAFEFSMDSLKRFDYEPLEETFDFLSRCRWLDEKKGKKIVPLNFYKYLGTENYKLCRIENIYNFCEASKKTLCFFESIEKLNEGEALMVKLDYCYFVQESTEELLNSILKRLTSIDHWNLELVTQIWNDKEEAGDQCMECRKAGDFGDVCPMFKKVKGVCPNYSPKYNDY